jgi:hypothetical protein
VTHAKILLFLFFLIVIPASAHEGEETEVQIGPGKAVEGYDADHGIKLSEKAKASIGISTMKVTKDLLLRIPPSAVIKTRGERAVYILSGGSFKFTPVPKLAVGDELVIKGAALLRVAEINVSSAGAEDDETKEEAKDLDHD